MRLSVFAILAFAIAFQCLRNKQSSSLYPTLAPSCQNQFILPMAALDQFILFGDSLIQHSSSQERGFALTPALQAEYIRRLDVVNRGFSGYNTDQAVRILSGIIPPIEFAKVRFLLIFFGANDACLEGAQGSQHVPLGRFKNNLREIINHPSVKEQNPRIVLVSTPPVNEYMAEENDRSKGIFEPRRAAEHTRLYAEAVKEVARSEKVALLDLWKLFMTHAGWKDGQTSLPGSKALPPNMFLRMLMHDGLHFTGLAYTLFHQELLRVIAREWPDQTPEKLPFVFPVWNDPIQWENYEARKHKV